MSLHAAVQDASQSISKIISSDWVVRKIWTWGLLAVISTLVIVAAFQVDAKLSRIIVAVFGSLMDALYGVTDCGYRDDSVPRMRYSSTTEHCRRVFHS